MYVAELEAITGQLSYLYVATRHRKLGQSRSKFLELKTTCDRTKWNLLIQLRDNVNTRNAHVG